MLKSFYERYLKNFGRTMRTVIHLRAEQIFFQILIRIKVRKKPRIRGLKRRSVRNKLDVHETREQSIFGPNTFKALNIHNDDLRAHWQTRREADLFTYNSHYFDDVVAFGSRERFDWHISLIEDWIRLNQPVLGAAWDAYPTSIRSVNWIKLILRTGVDDAKFNESLEMHGFWLESNIEWHLFGNHLIANAKALIFLGHFFRGSDAERWRVKGEKILSKELAEQFFTDGGHFERSPMYHLIILEDLLDLLALYDFMGFNKENKLLVDIRRLIPLCFEWIFKMLHPDRSISFFNDTTFGVSASVGVLRAYAQSLGMDIRSIWVTEGVSESGFVRLENSHAVLIADVGCVGPLYQPGHAHAGTLSFELSVLGHRFFVNSGISTYASEDERKRQRGTPAHNTVVVNAENSSEVWDSFKVGRKAKVDVISCNSTAIKKTVVASHDGYAFLPSKPQHQRSISLSPGGVSVQDVVSGKTVSEARFHLHPEVNIVSSVENLIVTKVDEQLISIKLDTPYCLKKSTWNHEFGKKQKNIVIVQKLVEGACLLEVDWRSSIVN